MGRLSNWLGKAPPPSSSSVPQTAPPHAYQRYQEDLLLDSLRTRAPSQWYSNKLALAQSAKGVVFLAVNTLATQFAAAKPVLYELNDDEMDEDGKTRLSRFDPMYRLLRNPNPLDTWGDVAYQMSMQLDLTGMALIWMPPDEREGFEPNEMYVIPTATAFPVPRSPQFPQGGYRVVPYYSSAFAMAPGYGSAAGATIPAEQVIAVRNHHPFIRWEGFAVLTAISLSVDTINGIDQSRFAAMQQGCEQTIALELDSLTQNPGKEDLRKIREEWQKVYAGAQNAGKIVITPPGAKINNFSTEPDKMAWQEGWSQIADMILACYQTPKAITGMSGDLNYATLYASLRQFNLMSLDPRMGKFGGSMTKHWIQPTYGDQYLLEIEGRKIDDEQLLLAKINTLQKSGSITHQEARRILGVSDMDPAKEPWVLERCFAATGPEKPPAGQEGPREGQEQDPAVEAVEAARPTNPLGDGSLGPRKALHEGGDLLATAFERHLTRGVIHPHSNGNGRIPHGR